MNTTLQFRRLGTMLDCSRNAVPNLESLKAWIDLTADLGYTTLMLYTEDTYEVDENPYFGYMRGRFSKEELREIDDYAKSRHVELIPCIQTLAHLQAIKRWPEYERHFDADDILLVGDERVYELIDQIFATLVQCFSSRIVHIGMDEAEMLGRGRYLDQHGYQKGSDILLTHVKRVAEIGAKYGFSFLMWSDLFFKLANGGVYYEQAQIGDNVSSQIPENVTLIYWDYYSTDSVHYNKMMQAHQQLKSDSWFAGGLWSWTGFASHNGYSILEVRAAMQSCRDNGVQDIFFTLWGDDGGECSRFSLLPSLFYTSELAHGNWDEQEIKRRFQAKYHIPFEAFMLLDLPGTPNGLDTAICNAEKYLLYQDCFMGLLDMNVASGTGAQYAACAARLSSGVCNQMWGYLFATQKALCEVLSLKADLGIRTHQVYASRDRQALAALLTDYQEVEKRIQAFYQTLKRQWFLENKPHGFDVQDIRLGGLLQRVRSCRERLQALYDGVIDQIEELEESQLEMFGHGTVRHEVPVCFSAWKRNVTVNPI